MSSSQEDKRIIVPEIIENVDSKVKACLTGLENAASSSSSNAAEIVSNMYRFKLPYINELAAHIQPLHSSTANIGCATRCRPWNHADYIERLKTFTIAKWFAKPQAIGAMACAMYGWINSGVDTLQCPCCKKVLKIILNDNLEMEVTQRTTMVYIKQIREGHLPECAWKDNPSPISFTMLPVLTSKQYIDAFSKRLRNLIAHASKAPKIDQESFFSNKMLPFTTKCNIASDLSTLKEWLQSVCKNTGISTKVLQNQLDSVLAMTVLALCGWEVCSSMTNNDTLVLKCELCARQIGLWNFQKENTLVPRANNSRVTRSRTAVVSQKEKSSRAIDPVEQHRWHCPWIVEANEKDRSTPESGSTAYAGWKQCVSAINYRESKDSVLEGRQKRQREDDSDKASLKRARSSADPVETFQRIRKILDLS